MVKAEKTSRVTVSADGLTVNNTGSTFDTVKSDVKVKSGKWYYEVKLITNGLFQIGWCTSDFRPDANAGNGVGDDAKSWAYDGSRQKKWNSGSEYYGQYWYTGDHIGVALDLDNKKMNFYRNGSDLGVAFENFNPGDGLHPAATLSQGQQCVFNFGKTPYIYPPPSADFRILHCFLTDAELDNLNKLFAKYKALGINLSESGETGDVIKGQGFLDYGQEMGIKEDTDYGLILLSWKLGAREQWELSRDEFVGGWTGFGCPDINKMKAKLAEWRAELRNEETYKQFYFFVFDYLKEHNKTILLMEEANTVWDMLGMNKRWALWDKWQKFLKENETKSVSKDTWRQFWDFTKTHATTVDGYDEAGSWPTLMDEFVEWMKKAD